MHLIVEVRVISQGISDDIRRFFFKYPVFFMVAAAGASAGGRMVTSLLLHRLTRTQCGHLRVLAVETSKEHLLGHMYNNRV